MNGELITLSSRMYDAHLRYPGTNFDIRKTLYLSRERHRALGSVLRVLRLGKKDNYIN